MQSRDQYTGSTFRQSFWTHGAHASNTRKSRPGALSREADAAGQCRRTKHKEGHNVTNPLECQEGPVQVAPTARFSSVTSVRTRPELLDVHWLARHLRQREEDDAVDRQLD